jgi:hypothetical protein
VAGLFSTPIHGLLKHSYTVICCLLLSSLGLLSCWRPPRSVPLPRAPYEYFFDGQLNGRAVWLGYSLDSSYWEQNQYRWLYQATVRGNDGQWRCMMGIEPQGRYQAALPSLLIGLDGWPLAAVNGDANDEFFNRITTGLLEDGQSPMRPAVYWRDSTGSYSSELSTNGQQPFCRIQIDSVHKKAISGTPYLVVQGHINARLLHASNRSQFPIQGRFILHFFHPRATPRIFD